MARQRQMQQGAIVQQQQQLGQQPQVAQVSLWDSIDAEVEPLTNEQRQLLLSNEELQLTDIKRVTKSSSLYLYIPI